MAGEHRVTFNRATLTRATGAWKIRVVCLAVLMAIPMPVFAHEGGSAAGILSGLMHPVSGLDHVLAMVAVGIWFCQNIEK